MEEQSCRYLAYLVAAYSAIWIALSGYVAVLWKRERSLFAELQELRRQSDIERGSASSA
jgi:CcmD family protein